MKEPNGDTKISKEANWVCEPGTHKRGLGLE